MRCLVILFLLNSYFTLAQNNKENILGMNTNTVFIFFNINDTTFLNRVKKINPKVLRFPGGYGNFYHIEGSGYGFKLNEADRSNNGNLPKRIRGLKAQNITRFPLWLNYAIFNWRDMQVL